MRYHLEYNKNKIKDLVEKNAALTLSQKDSLSEPKSLRDEMQFLKFNYSGKNLKILSEKLGKDTISQIHWLELENQILQ